MAPGAWIVNPASARGGRFVDERHRGDRLRLRTAGSTTSGSSTSRSATVLESAALRPALSGGAGGGRGIRWWRRRGISARPRRRSIGAWWRWEHAVGADGGGAEHTRHGAAHDDIMATYSSGVRRRSTACSAGAGGAGNGRGGGGGGGYLARTYERVVRPAVRLFRGERHEHVGGGGLGAAALVLEASGADAGAGEGGLQLTSSGAWRGPG